MGPNTRSTTARASKLVEVARAAGVSPSTVSRILNGTAFVAEAKRRAVETAIAAMGFQPNPLARGLRQGRRMTIGIMALDVGSRFFGDVFRGITEGLTGSDYGALLLGGAPTPDVEAQRLERLVARRVDAIIMVTSSLPDRALLRLSGSVPVVALGRALERPDLFSLRVDSALGAELATRHLLTLGHRRIAHLRGPRHNREASDRAEGYRRALRQAGVRLDPRLVVPGEWESVQAQRSVWQLLDRRVPFTAIFADNDDCAYGAFLALHRRGLRVPDDVSLVGFDDQPGSEFTTPPLTTVRQHMDELGRRAVSAVMDLLEGRRPRVDGAPPVELVVRESTAPYNRRPTT